MPETPPQIIPPSAAPADEPEIHVIPEKFYGAALKARVAEPGEKKPGEGGMVQPPPRRNLLPIILIVVVLLAGAGGAFVYFNRNLLFPPPKPVVVETPKPPPPPQPPEAPSNAAATSTNPQSVSVSWMDNASNESGFRLERAEDPGPFQGLTSLPPNSTSFLDVSVQPGKTYRYRLVALNQGGESAPSADAAAAVPSLPPPPPPAPKLPPAGLDTDSDGLTDLEETLLDSDMRNPDTDSDGFLDGNEVFHLYNPNGRAPARLIDAKLVKVVDGSIGWSMETPNAWTYAADAADGSKAAVATGHGESFRITVEDNPRNLPVVDWYLASHPDVQPSLILQYRSKKGYQGIIGADLLTTYIPWGNRIFVMTYDLNGQTFINFRTLYSMMLNSLVLSGVPQTTAEASAAPLPFEPAATTTGVIAQPESVFPTGSTGTPSGAATSTPAP